MGIFDTRQRKLVKRCENTVWNRMFTSFEQDDVMITKLMVYKCISFADSLLSSDLFACENIALRADTILLAKMQFYHLVTKSSTVHNMFFGYVHELWINHYHKDIETANLVLERMHSTEKWYMQWYYDFYNDKNGSFIPVIKEYCAKVKRNETVDGDPVLNCTTDELHQYAARLLMDMHISFMNTLQLK